MYFINFFKNGWFGDFFLKYITKMFVYNIYIYLAYFFAEKYIIEFNTKYIFNYIIYIFNFKVSTPTFVGFYAYFFLVTLNMVVLFI